MPQYYTYFSRKITLFLLLILTQTIRAQEHPQLILTKKTVAEIRSSLGTLPLFDSSLATVKKEVDVEMKKGILVPVPKDMSGGYTHEQHKRNYLNLQKAGLLFQILQDEKYAIFIKDMLMEYAKIYPKLPLHPQERSYARGKLFWQCLNDANWLVYVSQAYECVYDWLSVKDRKHLETNLFKPFARFLSVETPQFFNRIHNHSTWGNVAVGMIGLVMNDKTYINYALHGLKEDNIKPGTKDNDGGLIKIPGQKTGFIANLEDPFSPEGYYTEGPYYQRYAMYPFMIFAEALQNNRPDLKIFDHKNRVLIKSVYALLNLSNTNGEFFPLNDGQKGMSYYTKELTTAVDIAYLFGGKDPSLLSIAKKQDRVEIDYSGLVVAKAILQNLEKPFLKKSMNFTDGSDGKQGGVSIIRNEKEKTELTFVMKYSAQGLSHGHYDKLSFSYYNNSHEILQDYGLARFVNIEQKNGGGYLKENNTWAKQTIAHNTIVQNETSHFSGDFVTGSKNHSNLHFYDDSDANFQIVSAKENNAYPGTAIQRTMALANILNFENPILIDIITIKSDKNNQYDLPFYYFGQLLSTNFIYDTPKTLEPLGKSSGYQHLWKEAIGTKTNDQNTKITWMSNNTFYTLSSATNTNDEIIFGRTGANDPEFNLRRDPAIILRKKDTKDAIFVSVIETHGSYNYVTENAINAYSNIKNIKIEYNDDKYIAISITNKNDENIWVFISKNDNSEVSKHEITINNTVFNWTGNYKYIKN